MDKIRKIIYSIMPINSKNKVDGLLDCVLKECGCLNTQDDKIIRRFITDNTILIYYVNQVFHLFGGTKITQTQQKHKLTKEEKAARRTAMIKRADKRKMRDLKYAKIDAPKKKRVTKADLELKELVSNGRDYSKPSLNDILKRELTPAQQKRKDWENRPRFISTPMGGMNKKY